eukprot:Hpha_TRINITY_DN14672_c0_g1::TRINITY_DN14672_c0_g1_i2::g.48092::m.48092
MDLDISPARGRSAAPPPPPPSPVGSLSSKMREAMFQQRARSPSPMRQSKPTVTQRRAWSLPPSLDSVAAVAAAIVARGRHCHRSASMAGKLTKRRQTHRVQQRQVRKIANRVGSAGDEEVAALERRLGCVRLSEPSGRVE